MSDNKLSASLSYWSGWCVDNEHIPDIAVLRRVLLDAKHALADARIEALEEAAEIAREIARSLFDKGHHNAAFGADSVGAAIQEEKEATP